MGHPAVGPDHKTAEHVAGIEPGQVAAWGAVRAGAADSWAAGGGAASAAAEASSVASGSGKAVSASTVTWTGLPLMLLAISAIVGSSCSADDAGKGIRGQKLQLSIGKRCNPWGE